MNSQKELAHKGKGTEAFCARKRDLGRTKRAPKREVENR